jgi:hypothetical protein
MTFGAHRGADQGAGRSTSRRDLLHLLGGSIAASPPSTADLLQPPGLTSTRPGRHTFVPDLHQHFRAGIFMSRPAYLCPGRHIYVLAGIFISRSAYVGLGSTSAFPGPAYNFPGQNIIFPGRYSRSWVGIGKFRPLPADISREWAGFGLSWSAQGFLGHAPAFLSPGSCPGWLRPGLLA